MLLFFASVRIGISRSDLIRTCLLQLFSNVPASHLSTFQCGHVVNPDHVLALAIDAGPANQSFEFTFAKRKNE
jgi:hypothetical protein